MATAKRPYQKDGRQHSRRSRILWCSECRLAFTAVFLLGLCRSIPHGGLPYANFITGIAAMIVVPCPLTWHSAHITAPDAIRHYITGVAAMIVVPCPLTWHSAHISAPDVIRHYITGVAAGAATRTEWHVNGHATTTRPLSPFAILRPAVLLPYANFIMDMALLPAAIFLFYGFCHSASSGADLLFAAFCCIFAMQMKIRASVGPFFRYARHEHCLTGASPEAALIAGRL